MKMIDVLIKLANGEIKDQTILKIYDHADTLYPYTFEERYNSFYSNAKYRRELSDYFKISSNFLNFEVELIQPKPKKYYLRLYEDDSFSYINKHKIGCTDCRTKFTQEEIDGSMLLKFIEQHGIKEEVEDNESMDC